MNNELNGKYGFGEPINIFLSKVDTEYPNKLSLNVTSSPYNFVIS